MNLLRLASILPSHCFCLLDSWDFQACLTMLNLMLTFLESFLTYSELIFWWQFYPLSLPGDFWWCLAMFLVVAAGEVPWHVVSRSPERLNFLWCTEPCHVLPSRMSDTVWGGAWEARAQAALGAAPATDWVNFLTVCSQPWNSEGLMRLSYL